jgi:hypothetical protein
MNRPAERYKPDNSGLYPIKVDGKYGFIDRSGKTVIAPQFDWAGGFSEGLAHVLVGAKWGYINTKGSVVITPQFTGNGPFRHGRALVILGNRFGFIDKDGKYICTPDLLWARSFSGDLAPVKTADGALAFMNRSGKTVPLGKIEALGGGSEFTAGLVPAAAAGRWGFIDRAGRWVINPQFEGVGNFADGLAPVVVGGRTGYIDQKGKFVINPQYDTGPFDGEFYDGYAMFSSGNKFGFIDTKGRVVVEAKFLAAGHFSEGLAPVQTEAGWGYIDRTGKMVINPEFDYAGMFQNGLARVTIFEKEAYITKTGAFVVKPFAGATVAEEKARMAAEAVKGCPGADWLLKLSPGVLRPIAGNCPPQQYQDPGACPFEGCVYRDWIATKDTDVYADWQTYSSGTPALFQVRNGEKVLAVTGVVVIEKPGVVLLKQAHRLGNMTAQQGEIFYVLTNRGEGFSKIMFRNQVIDSVDLNDYQGNSFQALSFPETIWWVQIRNSQGRTGWIKDADNFTNKDRFGN